MLKPHRDEARMVDVQMIFFLNIKLSLY